MKSYSQNGEDLFIWERLKDFDGPNRFLDIGANDGVTLSNTRLLWVNGWLGAYIEPDPRAFDMLIKNLGGDYLVAAQIALGTKNGKAKFYAGGDGHAKWKDSKGLLSTLSSKETKRWGTAESFNEIEVDCFTVDSSLILDYAPFTFINIDAEGMDLAILKQIDLGQVGCKLLCIEHNSNPNVKAEIVSYCAQWNMQILFHNHENYIMG